MHVLRVQWPRVPIGIAAAAPETLWLCLPLRRGSAMGFHGNPQARSPTPDFFYSLFFLFFIFFFFAKEKISRFRQKEPFCHETSHHLPQAAG